MVMVNYSVLCRMSTLRRDQERFRTDLVYAIFTGVLTVSRFGLRVSAECLNCNVRVSVEMLSKDT